jgi:hypothetical protein
VLVFEQRHFLRFHNVEECVSILEIYLKTMSYAHCRQSFFEKCKRQATVKSAIAKMIKKFHETGSLLDKNRKVARNMVKRVDKYIE